VVSINIVKLKNRETKSTPKRFDGGGSLEDLDYLRLCAILHDVGKPECWLKGRPWSEHVWYTREIIRGTLGEDIATAAMRHHTGPSYPEEYRPQTDLERIICLADNIASGADRPEEPTRGPPLPKPPLVLSHVISDGSLPRRTHGVEELLVLTRSIREKMLEIAKGGDGPRELYTRIFNFLKDALLLVPADTRPPFNDVSLWHHLKLTAAISTCIWLDGGYRGDNVNKYEFSLLSGDADRVSRYINISRRLRDLRAGSRLVEIATRSAAEAIERELGPECLVYSGGGGFLAVSPPSRSETLLKETKERFESVTGGDLTITVSSISAGGSEIKDKFGEVWRRAISEMRKRKIASPPPPAEPVEDGVQLCDACGLRPAKYPTEEILPFDASPRPEKLCEFCYKRRTSKEAEGVDLGDICDSRNFIGMIKADGDGLGEILGGSVIERFKKKMTPSRLSTISEMIDSICKSGLENVVLSHRGECIFAGGDDLLAVLPGEEAFDCALKLSRTFLREMAGRATLSAGLVLFKRKFPCYVALEVVSQLIENAKHQPGKGSVDFEIISAVEITRADVSLESREEQRGRGVTRRPYKWGDLEKIVDFAKFLAGGEVPPTQVNAVARIVERYGAEEASIFVKSQMGRGIIPWEAGQALISYIEGGTFLDTFSIYNSIYRG
jgi:hypothetical protein